MTWWQAHFAAWHTAAAFGLGYITQYKLCQCIIRCTGSFKGEVHVFQQKVVDLWVSSLVCHLSALRICVTSCTAHYKTLYSRDSPRKFFHDTGCIIYRQENNYFTISNYPLVSRWSTIWIAPIFTLKSRSSFLASSNRLLPSGGQ